MSTAEMKIDLISRIADTSEPGIIEELRNLMDFELNKEPYQFTPEQIQRVAEARAEYISGNVLSEQQADKTIEQWLNEQ